LDDEESLELISVEAIHEPGTIARSAAVGITIEDEDRRVAVDVVEELTEETDVEVDEAANSDLAVTTVVEPELIDALVAVSTVMVSDLQSVYAV
jgi:hypothetical protein